MRELFPAVRTTDEFERIRRDEARLRPGILAICEVLGLRESSVERFPEGSLPVYAIGDSRVLKIYPTLYRSERDSESAVLRVVERRLPIPTPTVHAVGELEGWGYLLMERLSGDNLAIAWPQIPEEGRLRLAERLGETLAALHALRGPEHPTVRIDWHQFMSDQRRSAVERQRRHGLQKHWRGQIARYLDETPLHSCRGHGLLHTEVMREHLLVERDATGFRLSGLFDFEPAMVGAPEYEFAAVGLFFSCGDRRLLRRVLRAYGYDESELDRELEHRLLAYTLLHRYSNLPWYLSRLPHGGASTLRELAERWWGVRESGEGND